MKKYIFILMFTVIYAVTLPAQKYEAKNRRTMHPISTKGRIHTPFVIPSARDAVWVMDPRACAPETSSNG